MTFSQDRSSLIFAGCRKHSITFGSVLPVLGQMGSTRVLHRRYLRGEIDEEQWRRYRTQPYHVVGPLNFRPFLDQEWYESGGVEMVMLGISFYAATIPSMPTVSPEWLSQHRSELEDGTPPFSALLSEGRFVRRAQAMKKQYKNILAHPLLFEIGMAHHAQRPLITKTAFDKWKNLQAGEKLEEIEKPILDLPVNGYLFHNGGVSLGNVSWTICNYRLPFLKVFFFLQIDPLRPTKFPLRLDDRLSSRKYFTSTGLKDVPSEIPTTPTIEIVKSWKELSVRTGELYLGAETKDQELSIWISWDGNVFEDGLVKEWLEEIGKATGYYLC